MAATPSTSSSSPTSSPPSASSSLLTAALQRNGIGNGASTNNNNGLTSSPNNHSSNSGGGGGGASTDTMPVSSSAPQTGASPLDEMDDPAPDLRPLNRARAQSEVRQRSPFPAGGATNGVNGHNNTNHGNTLSSGHHSHSYSGGGGHGHTSAAAHSATNTYISSLSSSSSRVRGVMINHTHPPSGSGSGTPVTGGHDGPNGSPSLSASSSSSSLRGASMPRSSSHRGLVAGVMIDEKERKRQPSTASSSSRSRERGASFASNSGDDHSGPGTPIGGGGFECNICLDTSREPVTTLCGHLFCWPCLWRWLEDCPQPGRCPVCKAAVTKDSVIPLYARGGGHSGGLEARLRAGAPQRPPGRRPATPPPPPELPFAMPQELHWSPFLAQAREAAVEGGDLFGNDGGAPDHNGHGAHAPQHHGHHHAVDGGTSAAEVVMAAAAADHALGFGVPSLFSMQAHAFGGPRNNFLATLSQQERAQAGILSVIVTLFPLFVLIYMFQ